MKMKVLTGAQMKALDRQAIDSIGLPALVLMEGAGRAVVRTLVRRVPELAHQRVVVLAGRGNNGGDGLVVARVLGDLGASVEAFVLGKRENLSPEARTQVQILERLGRQVRFLAEAAELEAPLARADLVVDALLGIGVKGAPRGPYREAIERVNASSAYVAAVDLPSGLDADSGAVPGACVRADLTVTLELPKLGLLLYPGREYVGEWVAVPIGYPHDLVRSFESGLERVDSAFVRARLPRRRPYSHKGDYGKVLILAGSQGLSGAAILAARAALRAGAGLVHLCYPESLGPVIEAGVWEAVKHPLPEAEGALALEAREPVRALLADLDIDVLALGPGLSRRKEAAELARELIVEVPLPVVVDADGLNALAQEVDLLKRRRAPTVLTPHPGEFARLTGRSIREIESDRLACARTFAEEYGVVLVLKGVPTVTATPDGRAYLNASGNSGLASGGSGDVLTGLIAALLGQGLSVEAAAACGVWLHGRAADALKGRLGERGMIPGDLVRALPGVLKEFELQ